MFLGHYDYSRAVLLLLLLLLLACASPATAQTQRVDDQLDKALVRYAWFSSAAYSAHCGVPPFDTAVEAYFAYAPMDHQATLFRDDAAREFVLAFRGTSTLWDVWTDMRRSLQECTSALGVACAGCLCHRGFLKQFVGIERQITPVLIKKLDDTGYKLTVTGHSMGAAGASLYATALRAQNRTLNAYTYGQPRTGNKAYADFVDALFPPTTTLTGNTTTNTTTNTNTMFRATHRNDGVAQVPWHRRGRFHHHSTEVWIPMDGSRAVVCAGQEAGLCNARHWGYPLNPAHFSYFGVNVGSPGFAEEGCKGTPTS